MIKREEFRAARLFVATAGADLECHSPEGEIKWIVGLQPGIQLAARYLEYSAPGDEFRLNGEVTLRGQRGRLVSQSFGPVAFESGANPHFVPTSYSAAEAEMRKTLDRVNKAERRLAKRERSLQRLADTIDRKTTVPVVRGISERSGSVETDPEVLETETAVQPEAETNPQSDIEDVSAKTDA